MNRHSDLLLPELKASLRRAQSLSTLDLIDAMRARDRAVHRVVDFLRDHDVMVWPCSTGMPFDADARQEDISEDWTPIELTPVLQLPGLSIPVTKTPDGMPCGAQLIGPKRSDLRLIQLARLLEPRLGFVET